MSYQSRTSRGYTLDTYRLEIDLQKSIEDHLPMFRGDSDSFFYRREVPVAGRRPDFVCLMIDEGPEESVLPHNCSYRHAAVLALLRRRKRARLQFLAKQLYSDASRLSLLIEDLVRSGAVVQNATGSYSLSSYWRDVKVEVIAVEAKLTRWREALEQAIGYKAYADRAVVAMAPSALPRTEKVIAAFEQSGVGLCVVHPECTDWIVRPSKTECHSREREYLLASALSPSQTLWLRL